MVRWWSSSWRVRRWKKIYTVEPAAATLPRKLLVHQASLETCPTPPVVMVSFEAVFAGWLCRGLRPSALFASLTEYGALYCVVMTQHACGTSDECGLSRMRRLTSAVDVSELIDATVQKRQGSSSRTFYCMRFLQNFFRCKTCRNVSPNTCPESCMGFHLDRQMTP